MNRGNNIDLQAALATAEGAAREAGGILRKALHDQNQRSGGHKAEVDAQVEALLKARLLGQHACGWLAEEMGGEAMASPDCWVVDPHDGTGAFLNGRRGSSVSIALLRDGLPVLGVVYAYAYPDNEGDLISWAEGCGPVRRNGEPVRARLDGRDLDRDAIVALSYVAAQSPAPNARAVAPARFLSLPSIAYRLAIAAAGDVVAAVALNPLKSWDFAAGHALLRGAGGILLDESGREVTYTREGNARTRFCFGGAPLAATKLARRSWAATLVEDPGDTRAARPSRRMAGTVTLSRAQGCLLGQVAGDALGALVEFLSADEIEEDYPTGLDQLADGGPWRITAGQPTDDSEMALALARSIVRRKGFDVQDVLQSYIRWYRSRPFDIGGTTTAALQAAASGQIAPNGLESQANGSLMRVSPIGILAAGQPALAARLAAEDSALTHPNPVCVAACAAYAAAIATGVAGGSADAMLRAAEVYAGEGPGADAVRARLQAAFSGPPADFERHMGWVLTALQNAFYHLAAGRDLKQAVVETVAHGGDTDTNAAIVGALLGAWRGQAAIPRQWRLSVLTCRPQKESGSQQPRPMDFWPDDLLDLAEGLLDVGSH
jgi:ADP-ribosylglycohydrolase/fructose-1,6-bisphosphatase/inositol monophosphatase family enzyme